MKGEYESGMGTVSLCVCVCACAHHPSVIHTLLQMACILETDGGGVCVGGRGVFSEMIGQ